MSLMYCTKCTHKYGTMNRHFLEMNCTNPNECSHIFPTNSNATCQFIHCNTIDGI